MTREKFGWEREEQFDVKRLKLAQSIIEPRPALIVIAGGLAFLFLVFLIAPPLLFGPSVGLLTLVPLMGLYGFIAFFYGRLLRIDQFDDDDQQVDARPRSEDEQGHPRSEEEPS